MPAAAAAPIHQWMSALADTTRTRALRLLQQHELTVAELCSVLQLPQSTVSRHLKVLADERWVDSRRDGTSRLYRLALDTLDPAARRLWTLIKEQTENANRSSGGANGSKTPRKTIPRVPNSGGGDDRRLARVLARRQTRSQAFFASAAGQWDKLRTELFGDRFDLWALITLLDRDWIVGDLGCGTGQLSEALAPFVRRVIAVDASAPMLTAARKRLRHTTNTETRKGQLTDLPVDNATFDAAILSLVLHHLADPAAAIREAARTLQPGGRLLIIDMLKHDRRQYTQEMGHVWLGFQPEQITQWCADAGLADPNCRELPTDPSSRGPDLFAAIASRKSKKRRAKPATSNRR